MFPHPPVLVMAAARAAGVATVKKQQDKGGDDADHDGDKERGQEVPGVRLGVKVSDGQAGVGPGVVTGHQGVRGGGDIVPGVAHDGGGVAARADVHLKHRHPSRGGGGPWKLRRACSNELWFKTALNCCP